MSKQMLATRLSWYLGLLRGPHGWHTLPPTLNSPALEDRLLNPVEYNYFGYLLSLNLWASRLLHLAPLSPFSLPFLCLPTWHRSVWSCPLWMSPPLTVLSLFSTVNPSHNIPKSSHVFLFLSFFHPNTILNVGKCGLYTASSLLSPPLPVLLFV